MFLTLTCDSYGAIRNGAPVDPDTYDYRRAARDAIHFSALVDRLMQNLRRVLGWEVQYFATVEPQNAPHRICTPRCGARSPPDHPPGRRRHLPPGVVAQPRPPRLPERP